MSGQKGAHGILVAQALAWGLRDCPSSTLPWPAPPRSGEGQNWKEHGDMPTLPTEPSGHRVCIQRPSAGVDAAQADRNDISKETSDLGHHDCTLRHRT